MLVTDRKSSLPLWEKAAQIYQESNPDPNIYVDVFNKAGFNTTIDKVDYVTNVSKSFWFEFVRNRMFTTFRHFSDEELEAGINFLDSKFPDTDFLPLTDHEVFVIATKP